MAFEANAIVEATVRYSVNGQECMNVVHYHPGTPGVGPVRDLVDNFLTSFQSTAVGTLIAGMKALMSQDVFIHQCTAQAIWPTRYRKSETESFAEQGLVVAPCTAQNLQLCVTKKGDLGIRSNIGHFHLGGLPDVLYTGGVIDTATYAVQIGKLLTGLEWHVISAGDLIDFAPVILNKTLIPGSDPKKYQISGSTVQTAVEFNETLRVMRRRTVGLGI